ncbi:MAG: DUF4136 domain-containing protein [Litorilituus sp.]|jgi:hypothetical protein|nr:DUF4136 domain-containing protein [Litorilituus sp.]
MTKSIAIVLFLFFLTACSSVKNAGVVYHQSFNFSAVKKYSLYERNSSFTDSQSLLDAHRNAIEIAIEMVMAKHSFNYTNLAQADVIVTYHLLNGNRQEYTNYNQVIRFCSYCLRASAWQTADKYKEPRLGSLILDIVDPKKQRSVWRSVYPLAIKDEDNSATSNEKIQHAITTMLAQYPHSQANQKQTD